MSSAGLDPADEAAWPFDQGPNVAAITVRAVLDGDPVLHVAHDEVDDGWQFLDGRDVDEDEARVVSMATVVALDPSVREVADLPPGWIAWREGPGAPWQRQVRG
jgi:hypothetical protein